MHTTILDTIQTLAYLFSRKNIITCPFDVSYKEKIVKPEMEVIVIRELIMLLNDTLIEYEKQEKKPHKFSRYFATFVTAYEENFDNGTIVPQVTKKKKKA